MNKDLQKLTKLQEIDRRISELNQSKEQFPVEVERLSKEIGAADDAVESLGQKIADTAQEKTNVKEQVVQSKAALEKSAERLNAITTNREYDAVHAEIDQHKHVISHAENRIKNFDQETQQLTEEKQKAQEEADRIHAENQPIIDELNSKIASIDSDIAAVVSERDALTPEIGRQYLRTYDHIRSRRKNTRILSRVSAADRTCSICHKILEPQLMNEVRKGQRLQICESCGSILVWAAEEVVEEPDEEAPPEPATTEPEDANAVEPEQTGGDENDTGEPPPAHEDSESEKAPPPEQEPETGSSRPEPDE